MKGSELLLYADRQKQLGGMVMVGMGGGREMGKDCIYS
jgi:hypothetical protein